MRRRGQSSGVLRDERIVTVPVCDVAFLECGLPYNRGILRAVRTSVVHDGFDKLHGAPVVHEAQPDAVPPSTYGKVVPRYVVLDGRHRLVTAIGLRYVRIHVRRIRGISREDVIKHFHLLRFAMRTLPEHVPRDGIMMSVWRWKCWMSGVPVRVSIPGSDERPPHPTGRRRGCPRPEDLSRVYVQRECDDAPGVDWMSGFGVAMNKKVFELSKSLAGLDPASCIASAVWTVRR